MPPPPPPSSDDAAPTGGRKRSAWMKHVMQTKKAHKGKTLSEVLKMAAKTYKKTKKGGSPMPLSGGRRHTRRGSRKGGRRTRKH